MLTFEGHSDPAMHTFAETAVPVLPPNEDYTHAMVYGAACDGWAAGIKWLLSEQSGLMALARAWLELADDGDVLCANKQEQMNALARRVAEAVAPPEDDLFDMTGTMARRPDTPEPGHPTAKVPGEECPECLTVASDDCTTCYGTGLVCEEDEGWMVFKPRWMSPDSWERLTALVERSGHEVEDVLDEVVAAGLDEAERLLALKGGEDG